MEIDLNWSRRRRTNIDYSSILDRGRKSAEQTHLERNLFRQELRYHCHKNNICTGFFFCFSYLIDWRHDNDINFSSKKKRIQFEKPMLSLIYISLEWMYKSTPQMSYLVFSLVYITSVVSLSSFFCFVLLFVMSTSFRDKSSNYQSLRDVYFPSI